MNLPERTAPGKDGMRDLIRSFDWATTTLGPRDRWPVSLQTVVDVMLDSRFPMALLWGPELILIYNAAYQVVAGDKHPAAFGRSTREIWSEVWHINQPIFDAVMERGETLYFEDKLFPINRHGQMEDAYFTLGYSPVRTEDGAIGGALVILQETTLARQRLRQVQESEAKYRDLFENMTEEVHFWKLVRDERGEIKTWRLVDINPAGLKGWGKTRAEVVGKTADEIFPGATAHFMPIVLKTFAEGVPHLWESYFPGLKQHLRMTSVPLGEFFITTGVDITRRKQAEEALADDLRAMTKLHGLGQTFVHGGDLQPELDRIVETAIAIAHADMGNIQLLDSRSGCLEIRAQCGFQQPWLDFWKQVDEGLGACGTALLRGERVIIEDVTQSPIFAGKPALEVQLGAGVRAVVSTPLRDSDGVVLGMFSVHFRQPCRPEPRVLQRLDVLARLTADMIAHTRAEAALRESEKELRALAAHLQSVQEEQRQRIAHELHDDLGSRLTALRLELAALDNEVAAIEPATAQQTKAMDALLEQTIEATRRICNELHPPGLDELGLVVTLEWLVDGFRQRTGIAVTPHFPAEEPPMETSRALAVFRICQEALTNVARHAGASQVEVNLSACNDRLVLTVRDNGQGFTPVAMGERKTFGLAGMRERARVFGGTVKIESQPGQGTTVIMDVPMRQQGS